MKKLFMVLPLVFLLCFTFACQDKEAMAELEKYRAQAALKEQNVALAKKMFEAWGKGDMETYGELMAPGYVYYYPSGTEKSSSLEEIREMAEENTLIHFIIGVHNVTDMMFFNKILLLGYKTFGRGANKKVKSYALKNIASVQKSLPLIFNLNNLVCFDNLAIEQLKMDIKNDNRYMGDEGSHTMYIDGVTQEFCINSYTKADLMMFSFSMAP